MKYFHAKNDLSNTVVNSDGRVVLVNENNRYFKFGSKFFQENYYQNIDMVVAGVFCLFIYELFLTKFLKKKKHYHP